MEEGNETHKRKDVEDNTNNAGEDNSLGPKQKKKKGMFRFARMNMHIN